MRAWIGLAAVPLLSGCFLFSSGPSSKTGETPEELRKTRPVVPPAWDVHAYAEPGLAQPGEWARYRVAEKGGTVEITIGICGREGDRVWIEVVEEFDLRRASARLVSPDGAVVRALYREVPRNGAAGPAHPQELKQYTEPSGPVLTERTRATEHREVKVGTRTVSAVEVRIAFEDMSGRRTEEEWAWSGQAPRLFAASEHGGLVRKKTGQQEVQLLDFGAGYRRLVETPK